MSGFNANVAARKPRTGIARVISDMASRPLDGDEGGAFSSEATPVVEERQATPVVPIRPPVAEVATASLPASAPASASAPARAPGAREQVERLRERLAAASRPATGEVEPQRTAAAVRERIEGLRTQLESTVRERSDLARTLEEARTALAKAEVELRKERKTRAAVEVQSEERQRIADDAVAEAEALAAERDQVLADLAVHRRLESEQSALLLEAEAVLGRRDAEKSLAAKQLAEARELLDLRTADLADVEARLQAEVADRTRMESRCRELEREVARLGEANEALEAIDGMARGR
jgi:chromosome segregation ATPase